LFIQKDNTVDLPAKEKGVSHIVYSQGTEI
jgi:hypothetical protein